MRSPEYNNLKLQLFVFILRIAKDVFIKPSIY